jgi:hypothetical protein
LVELAIGELLPLEHDGDSIGSALHLPLEQFVRANSREVHPGVIPRVQNLVPFALGQG